MLTRCPHCGHETDVAPDAAQPVCPSCGRTFDSIAEARTIATGARQPSISTERESADADTIVTAHYRVNCKQCRREFTIPADHEEGACPQCGAVARADEATRPQAPPADVHSARTLAAGTRAAQDAEARAAEASMKWMRTHFEDRYEILRFVSRGGMGAVYRARQRKPSREVALKVMLAGTFASLSHRKRFEREAQAAANLQHPAIVPVYEYGEAGGQPYYTMEFVEGTDLRTYVRRNELSRQEICRMMVRVCDAIHYAHQHGVIHRDLKPGNVMVDGLKRPRVLDFGLSRVYAEGGEKQTILTVTGDVMGTPRYMSPEQAMGQSKQVDQRSDVYSLGVILYELIVGVLPYPIEHMSGLQALDMLRKSNALRPSALHPDIPYDLEMILLKAVQKDREQRYASAEALAQDLENFLAVRPISARPLTLRYRFDRWLTRNWRIAVPAIAIGLIVAAVTGFLTARLILTRRHVVGLKEGLNVELLRYVQRPEDVMRGVDGYLEQRRWGDAFEVARIGAAMFTRAKTVTTLKEHIHHVASRYVDAEMARFRALVAGQDYEAARRFALEMTGAGMDMPFDDLKKRLDYAHAQFDDLCYSALEEGLHTALSPDEAKERFDRFAAAFPRSPRLAEAKALAEQAAALTPDGYLSRHEAALEQALARFDWDAVERVLASARALVGQAPQESAADWQVRMARMKELADAVIRVETAGRLTQHGAPLKHGGPVKALAFSPDGATLAVGSDDGVVTFWDVSRSEMVRSLVAGASVRSVAFSPDGKKIAYGTEDGRLMLRAPDADELEREWTVRRNARVTSIVFSPDGKRILAACQELAVIGSPDAEEPEKRRGVEAPAAFSPDGYLIAASEPKPGDDPDTGAAIWRAGGEVRMAQFSEDKMVVALAFSPDGALLATAHPGDRSRSVRLWDMATLWSKGSMKELRRITVCTEREPVLALRLWALAFSPDGRLLATGGQDDLVKLWDVQTGKQMARLSRHDKGLTCGAFSPDGRLLATGANDLTVRLWTVKPLSESQEPQAEPQFAIESDSPQTAFSVDSPGGH